MDFGHHRKSFTALNGIYFWTATIHQWLPLLERDENKWLILNYLKWLSDSGFISVYAFVIMPNHMHLIWRQHRLNGKETPKASLLKYTGHELLKSLQREGRSQLVAVQAGNKLHEIWQRDSLGVRLYTVKITRQKLGYIHQNPVRGKWRLAVDYLNYPYSSVRFYETGVDEFGFLKSIFEVIY